MLPIILNNLFTRHRKDMAEAEKAREKARLSQRIVLRASEGAALEQAKAEAELKLQSAQDKTDKA